MNLISGIQYDVIWTISDIYNKQELPDGSINHSYKLDQKTLIINWGTGIYCARIKIHVTQLQDNWAEGTW